MAEVSTEGYLQKSVECSICLKTYNTQERVPRAFPCQHTVCNKCVVKLSKGTTIKCPTCNQITDVSKLITNFGLCNVVETICQSCGSREKDVECQHCNESVCSICLDEHARIFHEEVKAKLEELEKEVLIAIGASLNKSVLKAEIKKANDTIQEIKGSMDYHLTKFREYQQELIALVKEMKTSNMEKCTKYRRSIDAKVDESKSFLHSSEDTIGIDHSGCPVDDMSRINTDALKLLTELRDLLTSTPDPIDYKFVPSTSAANIGDIIIQPATSGSLPRPVTDYQQARSKAMTGSEGSGPGEFAGNSYVTCMGDRYIVSDKNNNVLKVYDNDLRLMFILGTAGDRQDQFNAPTGLCTGPGGVLFISDSMNHRIKVYSEYLQLERTFGSQGSGDNEFDQPMGLACTPAGELLVCDDYRVKVHRPDGTFIGSIGSRGSGTGQFTNYPTSVAATLDGCVLVNENNSASLHMFKINGDYMRTITPSVPNSPGAIQIWGFTVDPDGNIIIGDCGNHRLIVLDAGGLFVCTIGSLGNQPGKLNDPMSVAVNDNRDIVVYELFHNRIQLFAI